MKLRLARCVLFEYAATLGLVDVAYFHPSAAQSDFRQIWGTDDLAFFSRYDGLSHIRVTPFGAHCLKGGAYEAEPAPVGLAERGERVVDVGAAQLFACETPAQAERLAADPRLRKLCLLAGDRHLVVPRKSVEAFCKALEKLGGRITAA